MLLSDLTKVGTLLGVNKRRARDWEGKQFQVFVYLILLIFFLTFSVTLDWFTFKRDSYFNCFEFTQTRTCLNSVHTLEYV